MEKMLNSAAVKLIRQSGLNYFSPDRITANGERWNEKVYMRDYLENLFNS